MILDGGTFTVQDTTVDYENSYAVNLHICSGLGIGSAVASIEFPFASFQKTTVSADETYTSLTALALASVQYSIKRGDRIVFMVSRTDGNGGFDGSFVPYGRII